MILWKDMGNNLYLTFVFLYISYKLIFIILLHIMTINQLHRIGSGGSKLSFVSKFIIAWFLLTNLSADSTANTPDHTRINNLEHSKPSADPSSQLAWNALYGVFTDTDLETIWAEYSQTPTLPDAPATLDSLSHLINTIQVSNQSFDQNADFILQLIRQKESDLQQTTTWYNSHTDVDQAFRELDSIKHAIEQYTNDIRTISNDTSIIQILLELNQENTIIQTALHKLRNIFLDESSYQNIKLKAENVNFLASNVHKLLEWERQVFKEYDPGSNYKDICKAWNAYSTAAQQFIAELEAISGKYATEIRDIHRYVIDHYNSLQDQIEEAPFGWCDDHSTDND